MFHAEFKPRGEPWRAILRPYPDMQSAYLAAEAVASLHTDGDWRIIDSNGIVRHSTETPCLCDYCDNLRGI